MISICYDVDTEIEYCVAKGEDTVRCIQVKLYKIGYAKFQLQQSTINNTTSA
jgi:hypothetical protein